MLLFRGRLRCLLSMVIRVLFSFWVMIVVFSVLVEVVIIFFGSRCMVLGRVWWIFFVIGSRLWLL